MINPVSFTDLTVVWIIASVLMMIFLIVRFGLIKSWFILKTLPGLLSVRMFYTLLPLSIFFVAIGISAMFSYENADEAAGVGMLASFPFLIMCFVFMVWPPNWVKPVWLWWLEREYGYCLDILVEEAQKINRWDWETRVRTQVGMQAWIDDVFACRKKEINELWVLEKNHLLTRQISREKKLRKVGIRLTQNIPDHRKGDNVWTQSDEDIYRQYMQRMIG